MNLKERLEQLNKHVEPSDCFGHCKWVKDWVETYPELMKAVECYDRLNDEELFKRTWKCNDPNHDTRWCSNCETARDAMDIYQQVLKGELK